MAGLHICYTNTSIVSWWKWSLLEERAQMPQETIQTGSLLFISFTVDAKRKEREKG